MAIELPDDLIELQRAADNEGRKLEHLDADEREKQREVWFDATARAQAAVSTYAVKNGLNRFDVEKQLRQITRHPQASQE